MICTSSEQDEANNPGEILVCQHCQAKFTPDKTYNTMKSKEEFLLGGLYCNDCQKVIVDAESSSSSGHGIKEEEERSSSPWLKKERQESTWRRRRRNGKEFYPLVRNLYCINSRCFSGKRELDE